MKTIHKEKGRRNLLPCHGLRDESRRECRECPKAKSCGVYTESLADLATVGQSAITETAPDVSPAEEWTVTKAARHCLEYHGKYVGVGNPYFKSPACTTALTRVLGMCATENVDPALYLEAQFAVLAKFSKGKNGKFFPSLFNGVNAFARYEQFRAGNKRRTGNVSASHAPTVELQVLDGETTYGLAIVENVLAGRKRPAKDIREEVMQACPPWTMRAPERPNVRQRALASVLDTFMPELSKSVYASDGFRWIDVAKMLRMLAAPHLEERSALPDLDGDFI